MNENTLKQNLKSETSQLETIISDLGKSDIFGRHSYLNESQFKQSKELRSKNEKPYCNGSIQLQPWTSLIDEIGKAKTIKLLFQEKYEVQFIFDYEECSKYVFRYNVSGGILFYKDGDKFKEFAKIVNDLVFLQREGGRYERIGQILSSIQCKKIKVNTYGQKTNLVFETGSNPNVNLQIIPCFYPFYKLFRHFQKDEVIIKDKNTDIIYSTYTTKSLKKSQQSIFTFTNNVTNNIDKLLSIFTALSYIEILWFTRYSRNIK